MYDIKPITSLKEHDCGATSLKMLLDYYGIDVELDTLIAECNTRLIGCTAKDLLRVGRAHGMTDMAAFKTDAKDLYVQDRPAIIWWKHCHWCVFCGMNDEGRPVICNPDRGRFSLDKNVFESFYSGIALNNGTPEDIPEPIDPDEARDEALVELAGLYADQEAHINDIDAALVELAGLIGG